MRTWWADAGFFVDVKTKTVTGPVAKCVSKSARFQEASRCAID